MYVITRVFDDGWAEVYNTHSLGRQVKSPRELLAMKQDIIGMIVHNNKIVSLQPTSYGVFQQNMKQTILHTKTTVIMCRIKKMLDIGGLCPRGM